jgi:hypothetical protein
VNVHYDGDIRRGDILGQIRFYFINEVPQSIRIGRLHERDNVLGISRPDVAALSTGLTAGYAKTGVVDEVAHHSCPELAIVEYYQLQSPFTTLAGWKLRNVGT